MAREHILIVAAEQAVRAESPTASNKPDGITLLSHLVFQFLNQLLFPQVTFPLVAILPQSFMENNKFFLLQLWLVSFMPF